MSVRPMDEAERKREYHRKHYARPEVRAKRLQQAKDRYARPEVKMRMKEYSRRPEVRARVRAYLAKPEIRAMRRDHRRAYLLRKKYGIAPEQYGLMLGMQKGRCAICALPLGRGRKGPFVDHCHATGKVRALLCQNCNTMLGLAQDSPTTLRAAAVYLDFHCRTETTNQKERV